ncbi:NBS-containing resistance-like protein, partial [Trifolium medium]|nr:NBS-containing resistance-like protein [Trifolium medium]
MMINERFQGKRVLIVLDDVTTFEQLELLCRNPNLFGLGSVLIVTTRDAHLLKLVKVDYVCTMKEMDEKESKEEWKNELLKLERIPNDQVHRVLRISYDSLKDDMEKDIFLDICCFFIGKDRAYVTEILNGCGLYADIGIAVLIDRSLLKVEKNNKLGMHDLIRDMGREIVRQSSPRKLGERSRLWFHDDVHDVLTEYIGTENVEGLVLKSQRTDSVCFGTDSFKKMKNLRLLQLDRVNLIGNYENLSKKLKWVYWQGFTLNYIPDEFHQ